MHFRMLVAGALVLALLAGLSIASPAQTHRVIEISMISFEFKPNMFFVNEGDTVVLKLSNDDPQRPHAFNSPFLSTVDFAVSGQFKQGVVASDGTKYVQLEPGQKAEMTFVAKGRGQYKFVCNLFNHAARGQTGAFVVWPAGYHPTTE